MLLLAFHHLTLRDCSETVDDSIVDSLSGEEVPPAHNFNLADLPSSPTEFPLDSSSTFTSTTLSDASGTSHPPTNDSFVPVSLSSVHKKPAPEESQGTKKSVLHSYIRTS